ncbi:MAG: serine/threonine-protein kinase [Acidobacteria bacterium]|nr:serine/threonine-protein kinase [Acidobacteriota bacterium]
MGEVWRARDSRIARDVAIKVLPESFAASDDRLRRFEQEARAAGALNHPGLLTIFDVGSVDGSPYIVMELLEGETLRGVLGDDSPSALPLRKAIDYAAQIAAALAVAHEKGIIHRDLKPENLFITNDGRVKILDFGLAKLVTPEPPAEDESRTQQKQTSPGTVMGTAGYMSPEQVRAQAIDHRTDIFSLGAILYEMLSGRRAFRGESSIETMNAVLKEDPPELTAANPKLPPAAERIVRHCLEKNPRERFQSARDLAFQLSTLQDFSGSVSGAAPAIRTSRRWWLVAAVAAAIAVAAAGALAFLRSGTADASSLEARTFQQLTFDAGLEMFPALAPDGTTFAYVSSRGGNRDIYVQRVDGRTPINITKDSPADDDQPAFSRDGSQIAFRSDRDGGGIFVMGATGESVRRLTDFGYNPSWSPDGTRLVIATERTELTPRNREAMSDLWIIDTRTAEKRRLLQAGAHAIAGSGADAVQPSWSPSGKRIAFWGLGDEFSNRDIWTIEADAKEPVETLVRVTSDAHLDWSPTWSPRGDALYFGSDRDGTDNLWRIRIDEESGEVEGKPEPLALPAAFSGHFTLSEQEEIAFATMAGTDRLVAHEFDAKSLTVGAARPLLESSVGIFSFALSPDGRSIAFTTAARHEDLFVARSDGAEVRQLTNDAARDRHPAWSPDGKTIYFYSNRAGAYQAWSIRADGSGLSQVTDVPLAREGMRVLYYPSPSPDGRMLIAATDRFAALVHLDRPLKHRVEMLSFFDDDHAPEIPRWSPDGRRIVAGVNHVRGGHAEGVALYTIGKRRFEKISERGTAPQWLPDGRHVVFFERQHVGLLDVDSRKVVVRPLPAGITFGDDRVRRGTRNTKLAADASTIMTVQTEQQGDIWRLQPKAARQK